MNDLWSWKEVRADSKKALSEYRARVLSKLRKQNAAYGGVPIKCLLASGLVITTVQIMV